MKQILTEIRRKIDKTAIVGDFSTLLSKWRESID